MKFIDGVPAPKKKNVPVGLIVTGSILTGIGLLILTVLLSELVSAGGPAFVDTDSVVVAAVYAGFFLVPGLILLLIGIIRAVKRTRKNREDTEREQAEGKWDYEYFRTQTVFPVFEIRCPQCASLIDYDFEGIDGRRAWFNDGFVVCPRCRRPCRHNGRNCVNLPDPLSYAQTVPMNGSAPYAQAVPMNGPAPYAQAVPTNGSAPYAQNAQTCGPVRFCPSCGAENSGTDYCPSCGQKLK